ncbi:MAG: ATP-binding protein [Magnetococcus sp. YQC-5]
MKQRWTLHVRNFGPIQSADIDIHPFMMFVGPNNSGKSFLTTLIWGLLTHGKLLLDASDPENPAYKACCDWLSREENAAREYIDNNNYAMDANYTSKLEDDDVKLFVDWFNESLHMRKKELLKVLFNNVSINANELSVSKYKRYSPVKIDWEFSEKTYNDYKIDGFRIIFCFARQKTIKTDRLKLLLYYIIFEGLGNVLGNMAGMGGIYDFYNLDNSSLYLPSSRTGFMLNFRSLASSTIGQGFSRQYRSKGLHTAPTIRFLQGLIDLPILERGTQYDDVIGWLERDVIKGVFVRKDDVLPDYYYTPQQSNQALPLHVCSSLVTELAPLMLFLKGSEQYGSLIIEEPEAHLHPAAQRKVAQALVRLVNRGLPVWITTHSDIMFQQINNLITLSHFPNRTEICQSMGYEESDILDPKDAMAYQFIMTEHGTVVDPLTLIETGFAAPSFNKTLSDLTAETIRLHDLTDDLENSAS